MKIIPEGVKFHAWQNAEGDRKKKMRAAKRTCTSGTAVLVGAGERDGRPQMSQVFVRLIPDIARLTKLSSGHPAFSLQRNTSAPKRLPVGAGADGCKRPMRSWVSALKRTIAMRSSSPASCANRRTALQRRSCGSLGGFSAGRQLSRRGASDHGQRVAMLPESSNTITTSIRKFGSGRNGRGALDFTRRSGCANMNLLSTRERSSS